MSVYADHATDRLTLLEREELDAWLERARWQQYENEKAMLAAAGLTPQQYERALAAVRERLGL